MASTRAPEKAATAPQSLRQSLRQRLVDRLVERIVDTIASDYHNLAARWIAGMKILRTGKRP